MTVTVRALIGVDDVAETERSFGAVRGTARFASTDIEYRDVLFPAGTFIAVGLAEANRDSAVFTEPETFDITSPPAGQPQVTFGSGIHYCLGAALARAELQEALPLLAQRMPKLAIDGEITWKPEGVGIFGPAHVPITFAAGFTALATTQAPAAPLPPPIGTTITSVAGCSSRISSVSVATPAISRGSSPEWT